MDSPKNDKVSLEAQSSKRKFDSNSDKNDVKRRKILDSSIGEDAKSSNGKGIKRQLIFLEDEDDNLWRLANATNKKKMKLTDNVIEPPFTSGIALPKMDSDFLEAFRLKSTYSKVKLAQKNNLSFRLVNTMVEKYCIKVNPNSRKSELKLLPFAQQLLADIPNSSATDDVVPTSSNSIFTSGIPLPKMDSDFLKAFRLKSTYSKVKLAQKNNLSFRLVNTMVEKYCIKVNPNSRKSELKLLPFAQQLLADIPNSSATDDVVPTSSNSISLPPLLPSINNSALLEDLIVSSSDEDDSIGFDDDDDDDSIGFDPDEMEVPFAVPGKIISTDGRLLDDSSTDEDEGNDCDLDLQEEGKLLEAMVMSADEEGQVIDNSIDEDEKLIILEDEDYNLWRLLIINARSGRLTDCSSSDEDDRTIFKSLNRVPNSSNDSRWELNLSAEGSADEVEDTNVKPRKKVLRKKRNDPPLQKSHRCWSRLILPTTNNKIE